MSRMGEIFANKYKVVKGSTAHDTALADGNFPASGSYIDVSGCERFHVIISLGSLDSTITFTIKETDSITGTLDVIDATYCTHTIAADDDEEFVVFTIEVDKLSTDHHFVSCVVADAAGSNDYAEIFFLLPLTTQPVTQATAVLPAASQHAFVG